MYNTHILLTTATSLQVQHKINSFKHDIEPDLEPLPNEFPLKSTQDQQIEVSNISRTDHTQITNVFFKLSVGTLCEKTEITHSQILLVNSPVVDRATVLSNAIQVWTLQNYCTCTFQCLKD